MNRLATGLVVVVALAHGSAAATAVSGQGTAAEAGRRAAQSAPAVSADTPTIELVGAVIEAVSADRRRIVVRGRSVALHPSRLRVIVGGQPADVGTLRAGQRVRFALEPSSSKSSEPPRIVLIQIEP